MTNSRRWVLTSVTCALGALTAACGATTKNEQAGPDVGGSTHWLSKCKEDSECGSNHCYVGVCTLPCLRSSECGGDGNAQCVSGVALTTDPEGETCRTDASVCLVPCDNASNCGSGQACSDGFCVGSRASCSWVGSVAYNRDAGAPASGSSSGLVIPANDDASAPFPVSSNPTGDPTAFPGPVGSDGPSSSVIFTEILPTASPSPPGSSSASEAAFPGPAVSFMSTAPVPAEPSGTVWAPLSQRALSGADDAPVPTMVVTAFALPGYCDSNSLDGLSSSLTLIDAESNTYKLNLQAGEQDCGSNQCGAEGRPSEFASLVVPLTYPFFGFGLEVDAQQCPGFEGEGAACQPRYKLPWGEYTVQFCAYPGELEFPDGTRDILCKRTSDTPVCGTGTFKYPGDTYVYIELPEVQ